MGDPVRIQQVILNLLNNAIKFTDEGSVWLTASIADESSNPLLLVKIRDTGRGISQENQEQLFKPFTQIGNAITSGGAGLGLFISKMIVQGMGGSIGMESKEHEGSEFWFSIPLIPAANSPLKLFHVVTERKRVMLVHHVGVVRESIEKYLKERGHSVVLLEEYPTFEDLDAHAILIEYDQQVDLLAKSWREKNKDLLVVMIVGQEKYNCNNKDWKAIHKPIRLKRLFKCIEEQVLEAIIPEEPKKILSGCRILIAEDNVVNQKVLTHILDKEDCMYVITSNGQEVVDKTKEEQFDLILMDWQMPIMDGIEATNQIREFDPHIPIIGLTAAPNQWKNCLEAGMNDVLTKPFKPAQLRERIARYLNKRDFTVE